MAGAFFGRPRDARVGCATALATGMAGALSVRASNVGSPELVGLMAWAGSGVVSSSMCGVEAAAERALRVRPLDGGIISCVGAGGGRTT